MDKISKALDMTKNIIRNKTGLKTIVSQISTNEFSVACYAKSYYVGELWISLIKNEIVIGSVVQGCFLDLKNHPDHIFTGLISDFKEIESEEQVSQKTLFLS